MTNDTETIYCDAEGCAWLEDASNDKGLPCVTIVGRCGYEARVHPSIAQAFRHMNMMLDTERKDRMWSQMDGV